MLVKNLLYKNPLYTATLYQMALYEYAYLNGDVFKRSVRKKRPSEDAVLYTDCVNNTTAQPIARFVVDTINDLVFENTIKREVNFATPEGNMLEPGSQDWAELFELDADLTNNNLNGVMESIGDLTSIFGHCWVFVDMPQGAVNANTKNLRPYVIPVSPLNVWDWEFINVRGVWIPKYVKILERETHECFYFKVYYCGTSTSPSYWESYEVEKKDKMEGDIQPNFTGVFPLGMSIPGFIAYTKRDPRRFELGISDIDVATDVQQEHYKLECEAYQALQFARTLIRADAGVKIPAHAGAIVRATQGQIETLSVDTGDVTAIIAKQDALLQQFEVLVGFGGISKSTRQVQSGVSIIEERRQLHRVAKAKARLMEVAEEQIWTFASRFMGVRWAGEVQYGTDYEAHDTAYRIALMEKAQQLVPDNPVLKGLMLKELIGMLAPPHEVQEYQAAILASQDPTVQMLEQEELGEVYTRDIGNQTPDDWNEGDEIDEDAKAEMEEKAEDTSLVGEGASINYVGQSFTVPDAIAAQLVSPYAGR